jgi:hypothetical protein
VKRSTLAIDVGIAAALAAFVLVVSPGVAIGAIVAILIVIACGVSLAIERVTGRSRRDARTRRPQAKR